MLLKDEVYSGTTVSNWKTLLRWQAATENDVLLAEEVVLSWQVKSDGARVNRAAVRLVDGAKQVCMLRVKYGSEGVERMLLVDGGSGALRLPTCAVVEVDFWAEGSLFGSLEVACTLCVDVSVAQGQRPPTFTVEVVRTAAGTSTLSGAGAVVPVNDDGLCVRSAELAVMGPSTTSVPNGNSALATFPEGTVYGEDDGTSRPSSVVPVMAPCSELSLTTVGGAGSARVVHYLDV
jgi:hypothetical protein